MNLNNKKKTILSELEEGEKDSFPTLSLLPPIPQDENHSIDDEKKAVLEQTQELYYEVIKLENAIEHLKRSEKRHKENIESLQVEITNNANQLSEAKESFKFQTFYLNNQLDKSIAKLDKERAKIKSLRQEQEIIKNINDKKQLEKFNIDHAVHKGNITLKRASLIF